MLAKVALEIFWAPLNLNGTSGNVQGGFDRYARELTPFSEICSCIVSLVFLHFVLVLHHLHLLLVSYYDYACYNVTDKEIIIFHDFLLPLLLIEYLYSR